jgi:hypothetical protein
VTLRQVFIRVYRMEIQSVLLVFSTQLCEMLPREPSLRFSSPPPPSLCELVCCIHVYIQCVRGWGMGFWTSDKYTPAAESLYRAIFLDDDILHCFYESFLSTRQTVTGYCFSFQAISLCSRRPSRRTSYLGRHCCWLASSGTVRLPCTYRQ